MLGSWATIHFWHNNVVRCEDPVTAPSLRNFLERRLLAPGTSDLCLNKFEIIFRSLFLKCPDVANDVTYICAKYQFEIFCIPSYIKITSLGI
jgi:hypothetical protein